MTMLTTVTMILRLHNEANMKQTLCV